VAAKEALLISEARLQRDVQQAVAQQQQQAAAEQARLQQLDKELSARSKVAADREKVLQERERTLVDRERESAAREARCERERAAIERDRQAAGAVASAALVRRPSTAAGVATAGKIVNEVQLPRLQQRLMLEDTDDMQQQQQRTTLVPQPPPPRSLAVNEPSSCPAPSSIMAPVARQQLPKRLAWNAGTAAPPLPLTPASHPCASPLLLTPAPHSCASPPRLTPAPQTATTRRRQRLLQSEPQTPGTSTLVSKPLLR
jgi:hypothetical protein